MIEAISAVRRTIESEGLFPPGSTVVLAVSGGVDSMTLLDVMARLQRKHRWTLLVAHVDHKLRGDVSAADARFVSAEAARRNVEARVTAVDVRERAKAKGASGGLAAIAREARYAVLRDLGISLRDKERLEKQRDSTVWIATAHTASDQAETLLLRLLRGTGSRGLSGIPTRRVLANGVVVARPLLGLTREDLIAHAQRFGLVWREDQSNASPARMRNRVRHEIVPALRLLQPDAVRLLARAATQAADASKIVTRAVSTALDRVTITVEPDRVALARQRWKKLPPELGALVLRAAIARVRGDAGTSAAHVTAVSAAARRGSGTAVFENAEARISEDAIEIVQRGRKGAKRRKLRAARRSRK